MAGSFVLKKLVSSQQRRGISYNSLWDRGGAVARVLDSHQGKPDLIPNGLRDHQFPLPLFLNSGAAPYTHRFTLIGSEDPDAGWESFAARSSQTDAEPVPDPRNQPVNGLFRHRRNYPIHSTSGYFSILRYWQMKLSPETHLRRTPKTSALLDRRMNKVMRPMAMLILRKAEEYTTCIQADHKQGFQKCSVYCEQAINYVRTGEIPLNHEISSSTRETWGNSTQLGAEWIDFELLLTSGRGRNEGGNEAAPECKGGGNGRSPRKTHRTAAPSVTIPTCENPGAIAPGIEPGSPRREASALVATLPIINIKQWRPKILVWLAPSDLKLRIRSSLLGTDGPHVWLAIERCVGGNPIGRASVLQLGSEIILLAGRSGVRNIRFYLASASVRILWENPTFEIDKRGRDKGDTNTRIKCAIAPTSKAVNWRAVLSGLESRWGQMKGRGKREIQRHRSARFLQAKIWSDPARDRTRIALVGGEQVNRSATVAPRIVPDDAVGSVGFLRDLPFPPPFHSDADPYSYQSPTSALKTPMLRAVQISSLTRSLTHSLTQKVIKRIKIRKRPSRGKRKICGVGQSGKKPSTAATVHTLSYLELATEEISPQRPRGVSVYPSFRYVGRGCLLTSGMPGDGWRTGFRHAVPASDAILRAWCSWSSRFKLLFSPLYSQRLAIHSLVARLANRESSAARSTGSDARPLPRALRSQSVNVVAHIEEIATRFRLCVVVGRNETECTRLLRHAARCELHLREGGVALSAGRDPGTESATAMAPSLSGVIGGEAKSTRRTFLPPIYPPGEPKRYRARMVDGVTRPLRARGLETFTSSDQSAPDVASLQKINNNELDHRSAISAWAAGSPVNRKPLAARSNQTRGPSPEPIKVRRACAKGTPAPSRFCERIRGAIWAALNIEVLRANEGEARLHGRLNARVRAPLFFDCRVRCKMSSSLTQVAAVGVLAVTLVSRQDERAVRFPAGEGGGLAPGFSQVGIVPDDADGRRGFFGDVPFPLPLPSHAVLLQFHFTLISSQNPILLSYIGEGENGGVTGALEPPKSLCSARLLDVTTPQSRYLQKFALLPAIRLDVTVVYLLETEAFLHWLLPRCEVASFLTESHAIVKYLTIGWLAGSQVGYQKLGEEQHSNVSLSRDTNFWHACTVKNFFVDLRNFYENALPTRVIEVNMEWRQNGGVGEMGDPRENPPINGISRHDSHLRKSTDPAGDGIRLGGERANRSATMAPQIML
ncbi:hypothetical protein PR048_000291 [Dryococelus australis]|uniref:Uncharacterized protein n=1 Tax=Dryococelus australis TaxID=614101 RepID=A0ABQ9IGH1_9NEOP|nr:hypothetical protein PR048_000291 [Dryococelus australis]